MKYKWCNWLGHIKPVQRVDWIAWIDYENWGVYVNYVMALKN